MKGIFSQLKRAHILLKALLLVGMYVLVTFFREYVGAYISASIITLILTYLSLQLGVGVVRVIILRSYLSKNRLSSDHIDGFTTTLKRLSSVVIHVSFLFVILSVIGVRLSEILTSISLFAVAITLIFKEYISNFLSGFSLLFSHRFSIHDYIKIGELSGRITDISFQTTELVTDTGEVTYIPNTLLLQKEVTNLSQRKEKQLHEEHILSYNKQFNMEAIQEALNTQVVQAFSEVTELKLRIVKINKDEVTLKVITHVKKYSYELEGRIRDTITKALLTFASVKKK